MEKPIISVINISKKYTLGERQPYYSLRDSLSRIFRFPFRKEKTRRDEFWALKNISFQINKGDAVGVIGRNGAGKSTLLKILSQITPPTEGEVKLRGRVANLLEVGTGFHPELTGRENIYLNGAILGMKRLEINKNFSKIVKFAEIEKFIDTPIKHYSSGMYMRLAFAVAAHLDPEILLVDEVLAVGDAQFQKKCLGKMSEISHSEGRTILFVSHNLAAISSLCSKCIYLKKDKNMEFGKTSEMVEKYLKEEITDNSSQYIGNKFVFKGIKILDSKNHAKNTFSCNENILLIMKAKIEKKHDDLYGYLAIKNIFNEEVWISDSIDHNNSLKGLEVGEYSFKINIPSRILGAGRYHIYLSFANHYGINMEPVCIPGIVGEINIYDNQTLRGNDRKGYISKLLEWRVEKIINK